MVRTSKSGPGFLFGLVCCLMVCCLTFSRITDVKKWSDNDTLDQTQSFTDALLIFFSFFVESLFQEFISISWQTDTPVIQSFLKSWTFTHMGICWRAGAFSAFDLFLKLQQAFFTKMLAELFPPSALCSGRWSLLLIGKPFWLVLIIPAFI